MASSVLPAARGDGALGRDDIFATYHGNQFGAYSQRMVRNRRWKYVWNATAEDELYDLEHDPGELRNLAALAYLQTQPCEDKALDVMDDLAWQNDPDAPTTVDPADDVPADRRPTFARFTRADTQAIGVMQAARNAGLQVPQDLSVIGYDDIEIAELLGLTTIRQMLYESGQRGVELLLEALAGLHREPVCEVLPTELIERNTTAPPGS